MTKNARRLPAEWEEHEGTWISWPNPRGCTFPDESVERIQPAMEEIVVALSRSENVVINCPRASDAETILDRFDARTRERLTIAPIATNEPWCRDHSPVFVVDDARVIATCWGFNAWGGKYQPFDQDAGAAVEMANFLNQPAVEIDRVLEGGMFDSNGCGTALVARNAMLDPLRNPALDAKAAEGLLEQHLGIENVVWLDAEVAGDDTDGHVDTYVRFVAPDKVQVCLERSDDNYGRVIEAIREQTSGVEIVHMQPPPRMVIHGDVVPASYANFYVANRSVLVPVFDADSDAAAIEIFSGLFPDREIVPINCREIVWGLGAIHCLTCQIPKGAGPIPRSPT